MPGINAVKRGLAPTSTNMGDQANVPIDGRNGGGANNKPKYCPQKNKENRGWNIFKGSEPKMNRHAFQYPEKNGYKKPNQFNHMIGKLSIFADKEFKNSFNLYNELYEFKNVKIPAPENLSDKDNINDGELNIFNSQCKAINKRHTIKKAT